MKYNHLTLDDRIKIEKGLDNCLSLRSIAKTVDKSPSTVSREISRHICYKGKISQRFRIPCALKFNCEIMGLCGKKGCYGSCARCVDHEEFCKEYVPGTCPKLETTPYVCNGCRKIGSCRYEQQFYFASHAHDLYNELLKDSREGINQDPADLDRMDKIISPLLKKGQPLAHIYANHGQEIGCSRSTCYRYLDAQLFTARNIDLPRRVRYKVRRTPTRVSMSEEEKLAVKNRNYEKFQEFLKNHPEANVVEMDTVKGCKGSKKALLTLLFRNCNLMLAILLERETQECVIEALNWICDGVGIEVFKNLFPCILTDRGSCFLYPEALECDRNGEIKTRIFYCDPQCSWQKPFLEKNHEFIRYVVPKGKTFDDKTQDKITLMINHINSTARDKLNGSTPYQLSRLLLNNKLHEFMQLVEIPPDNVNLRPDLLK